MPTTRRQFFATAGALAAGALAPERLLAAVERRTRPLPDLSKWSSVRALFPLAPNLTHFASFYLASHPRPVAEAIEAYRRALDENPYAEVEHRMFRSETEGVQHEVRLEAAKYLESRPEEIALTPNTTTGLALVYHGLPLKSGDEILTTTHDHYVHHESIRTAALRAGASTRRVGLYDEGSSATTAEITRRIEQAIRPETRVLGVTWVHSSTGVRLPVRAIGEVVARANADRDESRRVLFVVDGVHGLGCVDEPVAGLGCDFFCAGTHKWIFAPRGTGLVWGRADRWALLRTVVPSFSGFAMFEAWMRGESPGPTRAADVSPGGFLAYEHQWAMTAAFRLHMAIGRARVAGRVRDLNDQCKQGLSSIGRVRLHTPTDHALAAGIVSFEVDGIEPERVVEKLLARRIVASTSPYRVSYVRLAPSLVNTEQEVELAVRAVREIAAA